MSAPTAADRSIGDLLRDLFQQGSTLIRQELELARTEVGERASALVSDGVWIGAGVLLLHTALVTAVAAVVLALGQAGMSFPAAAALVAVVLVAIGGLIIQLRVSAIRRRRLLPSRTVDSIKETGQWLRDQAS
jgi:DNA-binding Lrp family transcriptional regulator